jgi:hypothetical protein
VLRRTHLGMRVPIDCPVPDKSARCQPSWPNRLPTPPYLAQNGYLTRSLVIETLRVGPGFMARSAGKRACGPTWIETSGLITCHSIRPAQVAQVAGRHICHGTSTRHPGSSISLGCCTGRRLGW